MVVRRVFSLLKSRPAVAQPHVATGEESKPKKWGRRVVSGALICLTGGIALSALDDLVIYYGCSSCSEGNGNYDSTFSIPILRVWPYDALRLGNEKFKDQCVPYLVRVVKQRISVGNGEILTESKALEKASKNQTIIKAIGEPIVRGPWYNASLAVAHRRQSVSCTFPVSGPQGTGIFQLKAVRNGDDNLFSFLRPREWEILIMEALLHVPGNEKKEQTFRISVADNPPPPACEPCTACVPQQPQNAEKTPQPV